jgi:hypothetical protein
MTNATALVRPIFESRPSTPRRRVTLIPAGGMRIPLLVPTTLAVNRLVEVAHQSRQDTSSDVQLGDEFRAAEMAWLSANLVKIAKLHPGEWLAIDGSELIAHDQDLDAVYAQAEAAGHSDPFVTAVPSRPGGLVIE